MPSWDNSLQSKVASHKSKFIISTHVCSAGIAHGLTVACKLGIAPYFFLFMNISLGVSPWLEMQHEQGRRTCMWILLNQTYWKRSELKKDVFFTPNNKNWLPGYTCNNMPETDADISIKTFIVKFIFYCTMLAFKLLILTSFFFSLDCIIKYL